MSRSNKVVINRFARIITLQLAVISALIFFQVDARSAEPVAEIKIMEARLSGTDSHYELDLFAVARLSNITVDGYKVSELSGLAWDEDEKLLYALSDNGYVLHLTPVFEQDQLAGILLNGGYALRDQKQRALKFKESDSEGLAIKSGNNGVKGDTRLIISYERIPRIIEYTTEGVMTAEITLPDELRNIKNYRSENKSLEAITLHDQYGIITGPEQALPVHGSDTLDLYTLAGDRWSTPLHSPYHGALVDMTTMPDGGILALERVYGGVFPGIEISLHRITPGTGPVTAEVIYTFKSGNEFFDDNFEGITRYRDNTYFMISDDNNHPFKRTLLVYFSITRKQEMNY